MKTAPPRCDVAAGQCYAAAVVVAKYCGFPAAYIVHGVVTMTDGSGRRMGHAWVEIDNPDGTFCIDGLYPRCLVARDEYYAGGQINPADVVRYPRGAFNRLSKQHGNLGPWGGARGGGGAPPRRGRWTMTQYEASRLQRGDRVTAVVDGRRRSGTVHVQGAVSLWVRWDGLVPQYDPYLHRKADGLERIPSPLPDGPVEAMADTDTDGAESAYLTLAADQTIEHGDVV